MATIRVCDFCHEKLNSEHYYRFIVDWRTPGSVDPWLHDAVSYDICKKCYLKVMEVKKKCAR